MPNLILTHEVCRNIVEYGSTQEKKSTRSIDRNVRHESFQPIIQVEIIITGTATSLNPTWHKEEGWTNRRYAYARVLDEDGFYTGRIIKVYSTMTVDKDWTNTDDIGGLTSANQARFACVLIHSHWHILAPMQLASATYEIYWNGLRPAGA